MPTVPQPYVTVNPSGLNPATPLVTGPLVRADGFGTGTFILELGPTAFTYASMTTVITGSPASTTIQLQGSLDGVNWTTIATSTSTTGDTQYSSPSAANPVVFGQLRVNVSAVSGGASPTVAVAINAFASNPVAAVTLAGNQVGKVGTAQGQTNFQTSLSAATTGNGTTVDFGAAVNAAAFQITANGTITAGQVTVKVSLDNVTYSTVPVASMQNYSAATLANPYVLVTATTALFVVSNVAFRYARVDVSTNVTGAGGSVTALVSGF